MILWVLAAVVLALWLSVFQHQWRHRKDKLPSIHTALVEIEMILVATVSLLLVFTLIIGAILL